MSLNDVFEQDAGALSVQDNDLKSIADLAKKAKSLSAEIEDVEAILKGMKEQHRKLSEESIPEALAELGMSSFQMEDGSSVTVKPYYNASIKEERRAEAFAWLRDNGYDDLIKNTVQVRFGKGEDELCASLLATLRSGGFIPEQAEKVEPMTLKAWVKEQVEGGKAFPSELFGAYIGKKAVIKS